MTHFIGGPSGEVSADMFPMVVLSERALNLALQTGVTAIQPNLEEMQAVSEITGIERIPDITVVREYTNSLDPLKFDMKPTEVFDNYPFFSAANLATGETTRVEAGHLRRYIEAGKVMIDLTVEASFADLPTSYARNVEKSRYAGSIGGTLGNVPSDFTRFTRFVSRGKLNPQTASDRRIEEAAKCKPYTVTYRPGTDLQARP